MEEEGAAVCQGWGSILLGAEVHSPNLWWDFVSEWGWLLQSSSSSSRGSLVPPGHFPNQCGGHTSVHVQQCHSCHHLSVLTESGLQVPLCLTYVHLVTTFVGDLVQYRSLLLLWYLLLHADQGLPHGIGWLEDILPADKGRATVMMNKEEYISKMQQILEDGKYKPCAVTQQWEPNEE